MVLLAACVAAIAVTGVRFPGYGLPGWLDATFDPRFEAQQGRFPALLDWLPHLGELKAVTVMTFGLRAHPRCAGQPAAARTSGATSSCRTISGGAPGRISGPAAAAHAVVTSGSRPPCRTGPVHPHDQHVSR
jgi:hypothetical protein